MIEKNTNASFVIPFLTLLISGSVLACICAPYKESFIVYGLAENIGREIDYRALSRWLLMMSVPMVVLGWDLSIHHKIVYFIQIRTSNINGFYYLIIKRFTIGSFLYAILIHFLTWIVDGHILFPESLLIFAFNLSAWMYLFLLIYLIIHQLALSGVVTLVIINGCYITAERIVAIEKFSPALWIMPCRYPPDSIWHVLLMSLVFFSGSLFALYFKIQKNDC